MTPLLYLDQNYLSGIAKRKPAFREFEPVLRDVVARGAVEVMETSSMAASCTRGGGLTSRVSPPACGKRAAAREEGRLGAAEVGGRLAAGHFPTQCGASSRRRAAPHDSEHAPSSVDFRVHFTRNSTPDRRVRGWSLATPADSAGLRVAGVPTGRRGPMLRSHPAPDTRPGEEPTELGPAAAGARRPAVTIAVVSVAVLATVAIAVAPLGGMLRVVVGLVVLAGLVYLTISSNRDRRREEQARRHFDRHGRWPREDGPG